MVVCVVVVVWGCVCPCCMRCEDAKVVLWSVVVLVVVVVVRRCGRCSGSCGCGSVCGGCCE